MLKEIKKYIPKAFKNAIKNFNKKGSIDQAISLYNSCPVCNQTGKFKPLPYHYILKYYEHGFVYSPFLFETLNIQFYSCSNCGASDRERLIMLYIKKYLLDKKNVKLLDFAPAKSLAIALKSQNEISYRSADLFMEGVDDKVDIRDMDIYKDESFDFFICSHVLEHIDNDKKALDELYRITKKNGEGILMVPILLGLDSSVENKEYLESEHLCWKYFGQDDHVRLYSKSDFVKRLELAGFTVEQFGEPYFGKEAFVQNGIDKKSILYVVKKLESKI